MQAMAARQKLNIKKITKYLTYAASILMQVNMYTAENTLMLQAILGFHGYGLPIAANERQGQTSSEFSDGDSSCFVLYSDEITQDTRIIANKLEIIANSIATW